MPTRLACNDCRMTTRRWLWRSAARFTGSATRPSGAKWGRGSPCTICSEEVARAGSSELTVRESTVRERGTQRAQYGCAVHDTEEVSQQCAPRSPVRTRSRVAGLPGRRKNRRARALIRSRQCRHPEAGNPPPGNATAPHHGEMASPGGGTSPTNRPLQAARHVPSSLSASPTNTRPENGFARYPAAPASPACRAPI